MTISLRPDFDATRLRCLARASKDAGQARRLLALAAIYEGETRSQAAAIGGVTLQVVRDWVMRFNAQGPDGLIDRKAPGQPSRLDDAQRAALIALDAALRHLPPGDRLRRWSRADPCLPSTAWSAGGWSTCASGCGRSSRSACPGRHSAASCTR